MRKSRIKLAEVSPDVAEAIGQDPIVLFERFDSLSVALPKWAAIVLLGHNPSKLNLDIMFFEEVQDFFLRYAKMTIRRSEEVNLYCFMKKGEAWKIFDPPTLIGANLTTRLRSIQKPPALE